MTTLTETKSTTLARSLPVLVPLIKEQLESGKAAAEEAGLPYFRKAGELLQEAKAQLDHGEWGDWLKRNFSLSQTTAWTYMQLHHEYELREGVLDERDGDFERAQKLQRREFKTLSEFRQPERHPGHRPAWHQDVMQVVEHVDMHKLVQQRMEKEKELKLVQGLAKQIIDIGYKVLATKLHPDKAGGSREGMQRLNQAKDLLRQAII